MARGISITPLTDIFPRDIQQLEGLLNTTFHGFINQFKTGSAINTDAITHTCIAADAITAAQIAANNIKNSSIGTGAVTAAQISDGAVHKAGYFVVEGCRAKPNGGSNGSTVTVAAGIICAAGEYVSLIAGSVAGVGEASSVKLIYANAGGTLAVVTYATAGDLPATAVALASVTQGTASTVTAGEIDNGARFKLAKY